MNLFAFLYFPETTSNNIQKISSNETSARTKNLPAFFPASCLLGIQAFAFPRFVSAEPVCSWPNLSTPSIAQAKQPYRGKSLDYLRFQAIKLTPQTQRNFRALPIKLLIKRDHNHVNQLPAGTSSHGWD